MVTFRTKQAALAVAISSALALAGCGGDSDDSNSGGGGGGITPSDTFPITALDGYLKNAEVRVDTNNDNECETALVATTGENGLADIPVEYQNNTLCITALPGTTVDESRGVVTKSVELKAPAGERVVSPMTDLVVVQLVEDTTLDIPGAKELVVSKFNSELGLTADDIFTDYVAEADNPDTDNKKAQAINAIGEALFDADASMSIDQKLIAVTVASDKAQEVIKNGGSLDNFAPVIDKDGDVNVNERPSITIAHEGGELNRTIELGQAFEAINVETENWFSDNEPLTYSVDVLPKEGSGLTITENASILQGTPTTAGTYEVYVYADDTKTRSYPVKFVLEVTAPENAEPQLDEQAAGEIQLFLESQQLTQGQTVDTSVSIANLFTDNDPLTLTAETTITGLNVSVDDNQMLVIDGTPSVYGTDFRIFVFANDGVNQQAGTYFVLDVAEAVQSQHPLEGKPLYSLMDGSDDGDSFTPDCKRVWCDTLLFEGGDVLGNTRSIDNRTSCSEPLESVGSYTVENSALNITWNSNDDGVITSAMSLIDQSLAADGNGLLVQHTEDGETRAELYFDDKADAEKRIKLTADTPEGQGDFGFYQPVVLRSNYQLGKVSVSLGLPNASDEGDLNINLFFDSLPAVDTPTQDNCESRITALYSSFDIVKSEAGDNDIRPAIQFFKGENNTSCAVDFDITGSTRDGQVFGIIANANPARRAVISDLLFNIEWNHPDSGLVPEVTEAKLKGFLEGSSNTDYRYQGSLNSHFFNSESVEATSFFDGQLCITGECDANYTIEGDELVLQIEGDIERDQFIYASTDVAFAVTSSKDLIAWARHDYSVSGNQSGWTAEQLTGKTWFYVDDDSRSSTPDPMIASFRFDDNGQVSVEGEAGTLPWNVTNGVLTIDFPDDNDKPDGATDLVLNRHNASSEVVLATEANGKPLIMTENENLARGIFSKWSHKQ